jgi:chemotaxis protein CheD
MLEELVDLGEIKVVRDPAHVFVVDNLGSNVALLVYDMEHRVGGVANIVLPESAIGSIHTRNDEQVGKYANQAVPLLCEQYANAGGSKNSIIFKMVGGAQLFNFGGGGGNLLNVGARNAVAIRAALSKLGFVVQKADIGGNKGRSVRFYLNTGSVVIRHIGGAEQPL